MAISVFATQTAGVVSEATVEIVNRVDLTGGFTDIVPAQSGAVLALAARVGGSPITIRARRTASAAEPLTLSINGQCGDGLLKSAAEQWLQNADLRTTFRLEITNPIPPGAGLGGSSEMIFGMIAAMARVAGLSMSRDKVARQAFLAETKFDACGWQDFASGVCGGVMFTSAVPAASCLSVRPTYESVPASPSLLRELHRRSLLVNTGQSHFSKQNLDLVVDRIREQSSAALRAWRRLEKLAYQGRELLLSGQSASAVVTALSEILEETWRCELDLTQGAVQLAQLAAVHPQLRDLGHGKLTGAGAGGHYFFIANSLTTKSEALRILQQAGFQPVSWTIDRMPARIGSLVPGR